MVGQNTALSDREIRRVSQTAHEAHTLREARQKVQIGTGCIALPALGLSSFVNIAHGARARSSACFLIIRPPTRVWNMSTVLVGNSSGKRLTCLVGLRALSRGLADSKVA